MAGNVMKPCDGHFNSGAWGNQPVFTDGTTTSPIAAGQTKNLTVPYSAVKFHVQNPAGSSGWVTVSVSGKSGSFALPAGADLEFGIAGMRDPGGAFPTIITVVTAASTTANFWFDCITPDGA